MAKCPTGAIQLLKSLKVKLIEILSADADFVLQHADSRFLLSPSGYEEVKCCRVSSEKVRELVDHIIQRGPDTAQGLLELLKEKELQETFPMLDFLTDLQDNTVSSGEETSRKRKSHPCFEETITPKKRCSKDSQTVKEKQLMKVARSIGKSWREIGRLALEIPSVKLEQIEEDHSIHAERVFAMLNHWRNQQREKATAALLHSLLSQDDWALPAESIGFLLEAD